MSPAKYRVPAKRLWLREVPCLLSSAWLTGHARAVRTKSATQKSEKLVKGQQVMRCPIHFRPMRTRNHILPEAGG